jgi:hypothetical protein
VIAAVFVSDRGDLYLPGCQKSVMAQPEWGYVSDWKVIDDSAHELGMAGAVRAAWDWALWSDCDYLLHVEEDFEFYDLPLLGMREVLERNPHLASVTLKRDPWSHIELMAGGQMETAPHLYTQHERHGMQWVEHEWLFSLNPTLIPRRTLELGVPEENVRGFEAEMRERCLDAGLRFAYYGHRDDPPRCVHRGVQRATDGWRW